MLLPYVFYLVNSLCQGALNFMKSGSSRRPMKKAMHRQRPSRIVLCKAVMLAIVGAAALTVSVVGVMRSRGTQHNSPFHPSEIMSDERVWMAEQLGTNTAEPSVQDIYAAIDSHRKYLDHGQLHSIEAHSASTCALHHFKASYKHKQEPQAMDVSIEYVRIPPATGNRTGVVLFFHGCGHSSRDFCAPSPLCPKCLGLAEEVRYAHQALANGFEVIAVSSPNKGSRCWATSRVVKPDPHLMWNNRDVHAVLQVLLRENILGTAVPIVAMGASSGGSVLATLPAVLGNQLFAAVCQIAVPTFGVGLRPPVVVYDLMHRDSPLVERATREQLTLTAAGVRCGMRIRKSTVIEPDIFAQRVPGFPIEASREAVEALRSDPEIVDPRSGMLAGNPRTLRKRWVALVRPVLQKHAAAATGPEALRLLSDTLAADVSIISEQMNVLYAQHEFFADHALGTLRFVVLTPSSITNTGQ